MGRGPSGEEVLGLGSIKSSFAEIPPHLGHVYCNTLFIGKGQHTCQDVALGGNTGRETLACLNIHES